MNDLKETGSDFNMLSVEAVRRCEFLQVSKYESSPVSVVHGVDSNSDRDFRGSSSWQKRLFVRFDLMRTLSIVPSDDIQ